METRIRQIRRAGLAIAGSVFWLAASANAQSTPAQNPTQSDQRAMEDRDRDNATRQELARFDQFLDSHRETAEQLRKDPSLANDAQFLKNHPALQSYLQEHPGISEQLRSDPNAFMREEARYDRREDSLNRGYRENDRARTERQQELQWFDRFLDSHRETAEQLRKDPALANDPGFLKNHPELQSHLKDHPAVRDDLARNADAFMHDEMRFDRRESSDLTAGNDRDGGREWSRYEGREAAGDQGQRDAGRGDEALQNRSANFSAFLDKHSAIAQQLSNNPSLANDKAYLQSHPELQTYLNTHPAVRDELMQNPQGFLKAAQQYGNGTTNKPTTAPPATAPPATANQPKH